MDFVLKSKGANFFLCF